MRLSEQPAVRGLKKLVGWMIRALFRVVWSIIFLFIILFLALDKIPLGSTFNLSMTLVAATALCVTLLLNIFWGRGWVRLERLLRRPIDLGLLSRSAQVQRMLSGLLVSLIVLACALVIPAWIFSHKSGIVADAAAARANFQVHHAMGLDPSRLNQTLAEFERAIRSLEQVWPIAADSTPITLQLFGSVQEYHAATGRHYSAGLAFCPPTGAVVWVPLEQAIELPGENDETRTPLHEMVHAMMCQYLGEPAFYSIPSWFHEGMAQLFENEARHSAINRLYVWLHGDILMRPAFFCAEPLNRNEFEFRLFYRTALEFIRSLEARHGRDSLLKVVDDVQVGSLFEESLQNRFGAGCVELYGNWLDSW